MVLVNGTARQTGRRIPFNVQQVNNLRAQLLQDPFFDRNHQPQELTPRIRSSTIPYDDLVLLLAKLHRTLRRPSPLTDDEMAEHIALRNEVLRQPFFDREQPPTMRPFVGCMFEDEGYWE